MADELKEMMCACTKCKAWATIYDVTRAGDYKVSCPNCGHKFIAAIELILRLRWTRELKEGE